MRKYLTSALAAILSATMSLGADGSLYGTNGTHIASMSVTYQDWYGSQTKTISSNGQISNMAVWETPLTVNGITPQTGYRGNGFLVRDYHYEDWYTGYTTTTTPFSGNSGSYAAIMSDSRITVISSNAVPISYSITYGLNGGSWPSSASYPTTYTIESPTITLPTTPTRANYTFNGWTNSTGGVETQIPTGSTGDKTFYVTWTPQNYSISASPSPSGAGTVSGSGTYAYNTTVTLIASPNNGYSFSGWRNGTSSTFVSTSATYQFTATGTASYTGVFTGNVYSVTLNRNGGTINSGNVTKYTHGAVVALPTDVTRTGYGFDGWYDNSGLSGSPVTQIPASAIGNKTFYAKWTAYTYTVNFNANYSGGTVSPASKQVTYAATYGELPVPTRTGYDFAGWWTASSGGTQILATTTVSITAQQTLYAHWTAKIYTLYINPNHGTYNGTTGYTQKPVTYASTQNNAIGKPSRTGYVFGGWYQQVNGNVSDTLIYDTNGTCVESIWWSASGSTGKFKGTINPYVIAKWTPCSYVVRFNANGGSGTMGDQTMTYGVAQNLTINKFVRTAYTFIGWATNANGNVVYSDGQSVTNLASTQGTVVSLYAKWSPNQYSITYNPNGGTISGTPTTSYTIESGAVLLPTSVSKQHYIFTGWHNNSSLTGSAVTQIPSGSTGNKTFWAKWTPTNYVVSTDVYDSGYGTVSGGGTYAYGTYATLTATPSLGRSLKWWKPGYLLQNPLYITVNCDTNITAVFTNNLYTISTQSSPINGGTANGGGTYKYGIQRTLSANANPGYSFKNWTKGGTSQSTSQSYTITVPATNTTYTANFTGNVYSVTLNRNGGTINSGNVTKYTHGAVVALPTDVTRTGYGFDGWYDNSGLSGSPVTQIPASAIGNTNYWAKWGIQRFAITNTVGVGISVIHFRTNSSAPYAQFTETFVTNLPYGTPYFVYATAASGYSISGMLSEYDASSPFYGTATSTAIISATATPNNYTITLNANGGNVSQSSISVTYNSSYYSSLPPANPPNGYRFEGWFTEQSGGTQITSSSIYTTVGNITLYAHYADSTVEPGGEPVWNDYHYMVTINANPQMGGFFVDDNGATTSVMKRVVVDYGTQYSIQIPSNTLYTFMKWVYIKPGITNDLPATVPLGSEGITNLLSVFDTSFGQAIQSDDDPDCRLDYMTGAFRFKSDPIDSPWQLAREGENIVARSGSLPNGNTANDTSCTFLRTTLPYPGILTFNWGIHAPPPMTRRNSFWGNRLRFVEAENAYNLVEPPLTGNFNNATASYTNTYPDYSVEWRLEYNAGMGRGGGTGYVNSVTWEPGLSALCIDTNGTKVQQSPKFVFSIKGYEGSRISYYPINGQTTNQFQNATNVLMAFEDTNRDGRWNAGELLGAAARQNYKTYRDYDEIRFAASTTTSIMARYDLSAFLFGSTNITTDRSVYGGSGVTNYPGTGAISEVPVSSLGALRLRVVRTAFNDGNYNDSESQFTTVVLDRTINLLNRPYLTEADLLANGIVDLDWATIFPAFSSSSIGSTSKIDLRNATYRIHVGDSEILSPDSDTDILPIKFVNTFEQIEFQTPTIPIAPSNTVSTLSPTFTWSHTNTINKAYPAFRLRIYNSDGSIMLYDSSLQKAPPRDANGIYSWQAPADLVLSPETTYQWEVSMLDAKFPSLGPYETKLTFTTPPASE